MERKVSSVRLLPRFDSRIPLNESHSERIVSSSLIIRYHSFSFDNLSQHDQANLRKFVSSELITPLLPRLDVDRQRTGYDENQSADTGGKQTNIKTSTIDKGSYRADEYDIRFLERFYDRSGQRCRPTVNSAVGQLDLEYVYTVIGDSLESYIRCRKLNRCKALSNFLDYRDKIYKRQKIAQYAPVNNRASPKSTSQTSVKFNQLEEKRSPITPVTSDPVSVKISTPSVRTVSPATSAKASPTVTKESFIPIPSPELLRKPAVKSSKMKTAQANIPKKTTSNIQQVKVKRTLSSPIKGPAKANGRTPLKKHKQSNNGKNNNKPKSCVIL